MYFLLVFSCTATRALPRPVLSLSLSANNVTVPLDAVESDSVDKAGLHNTVATASFVPQRGDDGETVTCTATQRDGDNVTLATKVGTARGCL